MGAGGVAHLDGMLKAAAACIGRRKGIPMTLTTILIIILILILLGAVPAWPYSRSWGYGPSGIIGLVLLIILILALMGRI